MTSHRDLIAQFRIDDFTPEQIRSMIQRCQTQKFNFTKSTPSARAFSRHLYDVIKKQEFARFKFYVIVGILRLRHYRDSEADLDGWFDRFLIGKIKFDVWKPKESIEDAVRKQVSNFRLITALPAGYESLNPRQRLREAWWPSSSKIEKYNLMYTSSMTSIFVLLGGCILGAQHANHHIKQFRQKSQTQSFKSRPEFLRSQFNAFSRPLVVYGLRWGWRIGLIIGSFNVITTSLHIYRLQDSCFHYCFGVALPYAIYNWKRGPVAMVMMGLSTGLLAGLPIGLLLGTSGQNARPRLYDAFGAPGVDSDSHQSNWDENQWKTNQLKFHSMIEMINDCEMTSYP